MPSSFIVKAEKDGQALMLVINSDSEAVTYLSGDQKTSLPQGNVEQPNSIGAPANLPANASGRHLRTVKVVRLSDRVKWVNQSQPRTSDKSTQAGKMGETEGVPSRH